MSPTLPAVKVGDIVFWAVQSGEIGFHPSMVTRAGGFPMDVSRATALFSCMTEPKTVTQRIIYIVMFGDNGKI
jgi:hypothetical protein